MRTILLLLCLLLLWTGCDKEFIETDLTGKSLTVLAPADNDTVATTTPLFWWNTITGARNYRLQIVYPDFASPQQLLYDTAVDADRFYPTLSPGRTYAWRIRPENGSSEGNWVTRTLTIDSTVSLSAQTVVITSPASNGFVTNNSTISFAWNNLSGATFYRVDILNNANNASVVSTTVTVNSFSYTFAQGSYTFNVRGENGTSFTPWSSRTVTIDQTAPVTPMLVSPANNTFYASPPASLTFDWTSASDAITDSLYIATDSTFTTGIQSASLLNASQGNYSWTGAQAATIYYWRVRSFDAAGNRSNYSTTFKFTIN